MAPRESASQRARGTPPYPFKHSDAFSCTLATADGHAVVHLVGELDMASVPELRAHVEPLAAEWPTVVLDLSRLEFCDSSGLHAFLTLSRHCEEHGTRLVLRAMTRPVRRVFELTRTNRLFQSQNNP